jgi:ribose 5-phosphate isomerase B
MRIYIGADHRGFELKEQVKEWLSQNEYEVEDVGDFVFDPEDDYVDYALKVAESIEGSDEESRGILICGSGHGVDIVANRFGNVRAILGFNDQVTTQGREDENANILVLPADWVTADEATTRTKIFLETVKSEAVRHVKWRARLLVL